MIGNSQFNIIFFMTEMTLQISCLGKNKKKEKNGTSGLLWSLLVKNFTSWTPTHLKC